MQTPLKAPRSPQTPTMSVLSGTSMGSSTPTSSVGYPDFSGGSLKVCVALPEELPSSGPVYFDVSVVTVLGSSRDKVVQRRYSAFDALANKLRWAGIAIGAPDLPPKYA